MAVSQDKCIQCSSRARSRNIETCPELFLEADGTFLGLPYWFCSAECYKKTIGKFLDPRYHVDKKAEDDAEYEVIFQKARADYAAETSKFFINKFSLKSEM